MPQVLEMLLSEISSDSERLELSLSLEAFDFFNESS